MLGLNHWKSRLDEIYNAVAKELETMHKILETSRKKPKKTKIQQKEEKEKGELKALQNGLKNKHPYSLNYVHQPSRRSLLITQP